MELKFTTKQERTGKADVLGIVIPQPYRPGLLKMLKKYSGQLIVEIKPPHRPRSTGELSQNHKIAILVHEIAEISGYTEQEVKDMAKLRSIPKGYPYRLISLPMPLPDGRKEVVMPKHEPELSTIEAGILIDELELMNRELNH